MHGALGDTADTAGDVGIHKMSNKKFQKRVENFTCAHCGHPVEGNGYTNHCPKCLWSKHVDVHPGDRAAVCGGMMEPIRVEGTSPEYSIVHQCVICGHERKNAAAPEDAIDAILAVAKNA